MKKQKENLFSAKFRLLNSQEHSEEISWSSSGSSEFEDVDSKPKFSNITSITTNKKHNRKRKRKEKVPHNLSNLDITIIESNKESSCDKYPVLSSKIKSETLNTIHDLTYLVEAVAEQNNIKTVKIEDTSPILCTGQARANLSVKSPIIPQKFASPANSPKVRKVLFHKQTHNKSNSEVINIASEVSKNLQLDRRVKNENLENQFDIDIAAIQTPADSRDLEHEDKINTKAESKSNSRKVDLVKNVKSFFDSHFNSGSSSQHSITETMTPTNNSSDDVEILTVMTQMNSNESILKSVKHINSTDNSLIEADKSKKIRYKKDGLAYRLNVILRKNYANISLWQHERFLAENSNFKIPKGEHLVFRIQKVIFKFGCYLLEAMDVNDEGFLILINNSYVNNCVFQEEAIFKLYDPYQIFNFENRKLVVNVCKFECVTPDSLL